MRRLIETEAHLTEDVLPDLPLRQFVFTFTFPFALRYRIAFDPDLCSAVRRVIVRALMGFYRERARRDGMLLSAVRNRANLAVSGERASAPRVQRDAGEENG